jgi:C2H2-type zinc finger
MLVATRKLNCFGKTVLPGDPIPDPSRWNVVSLQANINIGWIADVPDEPEALVVKPGHVCGECGMSFKSFQALGGHKRRHRKVL